MSMKPLGSVLVLTFAALLLSGCAGRPGPTQVPAARAPVAQPTLPAARPVTPSSVPPTPLEPPGSPAVATGSANPYPFPQGAVPVPTSTPDNAIPYPFPGGQSTATLAPPRASLPTVAPTHAPPESTFLPRLDLPVTPNLLLTATPTQFVTPVPVLPEVSMWYTFTYGAVSIQYPADWVAQSVSFSEHMYCSAYFRLDRMTGVSPFYWINLDIYIHEGDDTPNPHSSEPNEGGYAVQWERPISVDGITGIEFVWGAYMGNGVWDGLPTLNAYLYYRPKKLDIRLTAGFDSQTIDRALVEGYQPVIDESYAVFHHMLQSIHVTP